MNDIHRLAGCGFVESANDAFGVRLICGNTSCGRSIHYCDRCRELNKMNKMQARIIEVEAQTKRHDEHADLLSDMYESTKRERDAARLVVVDHEVRIAELLAEVNEAEELATDVTKIQLKWRKKAEDNSKWAHELMREKGEITKELYEYRQYLKGEPEIDNLMKRNLGLSERLAWTLEDSMRIQDECKAKIAEATKELERTNELLTASRSGQALGPIVGAQTILRQDNEISALKKANKELQTWGEVMHRDFETASAEVADLKLLYESKVSEALQDVISVIRENYPTNDVEDMVQAAIEAARKET